MNVSQFGFWLLFSASEYYLPFEQFPWFRNATIAELSEIEVHGKDHFYWPSLDIDLSTEIILHPDKYKLVSR